MSDFVSEYVVDAIEKMSNGKYPLALVAVCNAIDATARKEYKSSPRVGDRYKRFLSDNLLIMTQVSYGIGVAHDLRFGNVFQNVRGMEAFRNDTSVSIVDIVYHVIRCYLTHEARLPMELKFPLCPIPIASNPAIVL